MNNFKRLCIALLCLQFAACASMIRSATQDMADNLSRAILNQNDMETVRAGAPAYLIMVDSFIEGDPDNATMLRSAAKLYGAYTSAFVDEEERAARLAQKAYDYAHHALCLEIERLCEIQQIKLDQLTAVLDQLTPGDQPILYDFAVAWAGWIQVNSGDWNALAQIGKIDTLFKRSIELDETYDRGGAHIYLGVLGSQIPPSLGGKPETARVHFDQAIRLSQGKNLMVKVLYAEHYARLVFDQELHDRLLNDVLADNAVYPELVLANTIAHHRAAILLEESKDFF